MTTQLDALHARASGKMVSMNTSTIVDYQAFKHAGDALANMHSVVDIPEEAIASLRQWLDQAPHMATPNTIALWGQLMFNLVVGVKAPRSDDGDARRLGDYFDAMARLASNHWWAIDSARGFPPYHFFQGICRHFQPLLGNRSNRSHTLLKALVCGQGWDPSPLLGTLNNMQTEQMKYRNVHPDWKSAILETAQGGLLFGLWGLVGSEWTPPDNDLYGQMWLVRNFRLGAGDAHKIQTAAKAMPTQTACMLEALLLSTLVLRDDIQHFFPLQLEKSPALPVLHNLIGLLTEGGAGDLTYKAREVAALLQHHHPDVSAWMQLHLSMFPQASESVSYAEMLVPAFEALHGGLPEMEVPSDIFEAHGTMDA